MRNAIARNLAARVVLLFVSMAFGAWSTAVLVREFGAIDFGLFSLAFAIANYVVLLATPLNSSLTRFLLISRKSGETARATSEFATGLGLAAAYCLLSALAVFAFLRIAGEALNVHESDRELFTRCLVGLVLAALLLVLGTHFRAVLFDRNRLDVGYLAETVAIAVRGAAVVIVVSTGLDLPSLAIGHVTSAMVLVGLSIGIWHRFGSELGISPAAWSADSARKFMPMTSWLFVDHLAAILLSGFDLVLVAVLIGAESTGNYAIALLPTTILRSIGGIVQNNLAPTTSHLLTEGEFERARRVLASGAFWNGVLISVPAGLAIGWSREILSLWFGEEYGEVAPLACLLLAFVGINSCAGPMFIVGVARNRVRVPTVATLVSSLAGIGLAGFLVASTPLGVAGIAVGTSLAITLKHTIFTPLYTRRLIGGRLRDYYGPIARVAAVGLLCVAVASAVARAIGADTLLGLVESLALCAPVVLGGVALLAPREERQRVHSLAAPLIARLHGRLR